MSDVRLQHPIESLLARLAEGTLTASEFDVLNGMLSQDASARELYRKYMIVDALLRWEISPPLLKTVDEAPVASQPDPPSLFALPPSVSFSSFLNTPLGNVAFSYAVSAVLVCIGLWIFSLMSASSPHNAVVIHKPPTSQTTSQNPTQPNTPAPEPKIVSIARITGMVNCTWENTDDAPFHDRVVLGTTYMLKSGLLEITYHTGAKVILQGPCTYEMESAAGGYLSLGKLTARVETAKPQAAKQKSPFPLPPSPLFSVRTPTAVVTDLGTEFGVDVAKEGATQVVVFVGEVVSTAINPKGKPTETVHLKAGQSASIRQARVVVRKERADERQFARTMPAPEGAIVVWSGYQPQGTLSVAGNDLLQTSLKTVETDDETTPPFLHQSLPALHDGTMYGPKNEGMQGFTDFSFSVREDHSVTFDLDTSLHKLGYTINAIDVYTSYDANRVGQKYKVEFSQVGQDGWLRSPVVDFDSDLPAYAGLWDAQSQIRNRVFGSPLATRINRIRFTFYDCRKNSVATAGGPSVYREIDVFGQPTVELSPGNEGGRKKSETSLPTMKSALPATAKKAGGESK